jgi:hypothetical protein
MLLMQFNAILKGVLSSKVRLSKLVTAIQDKESQSTHNKIVLKLHSNKIVSVRSRRIRRQR